VFALHCRLIAARLERQRRQRLLGGLGVDFGLQLLRDDLAFTIRFLEVTA